MQQLIAGNPQARKFGWQSLLGWIWAYYEGILADEEPARGVAAALTIQDNLATPEVITVNGIIFSFYFLFDSTEVIGTCLTDYLVPGKFLIL